MASNPVRQSHRNMLVSLLKQRRHYPYRMGVIQMACLCDVITNEEFWILERQIVRKEREPKLP